MVSMVAMARAGTPYHHGNLAAELEEAAWGLLRERGHTALSLREVARAAGVSHNAPYHHFADRSALLARLAETAMAELVRRMEAARGAPGGPAARAVALGLAYVGYAAEHPEGFRLVYDPQVCVPGDPGPGMAPLLARIGRMLDDTAAELGAGGDGGPGADRATVAAALWAAAHGFAQLVVAGHLPPAAVAPGLAALLALDAAPGAGGAPGAAGGSADQGHQADHHQHHADEAERRGDAR